MNKVKIGFFSFTEITDPNEHRAYNEWHQLDHMPEQFPLEGVAFGQRWVSTPQCRAARAVSKPRLDPVHYLTLYLMTEPIDRTLREFRALAKELARAGRFHQYRTSHLSGPLRLIDTQVAKRVLISAEALPYRPNTGVYVTVEPVGAERSTALGDVAGVAGTWTFASDEHRISVTYLDADVLATSAAIDATGTRSADVEFAGPFEMITPWKWGWFDEQG